jgi:serine/threonine protein kinase
MPFCGECGKKYKDSLKFCPHCGTPSELFNNSKQPDVSMEAQTADTYKTQVRSKPQTYGVLNLENLPEGHIIDKRYEIKEKLGQGGFGAVYRVYDKNMNIDKALKIIPEAIINDKEAMFDLQNEAQTMIALNHPNIVRVYDFHKTGSIKFIDMEYIEGKTLTEIKLEHKNKQIPEEKVKELAVQIASGMSYAHQKGILHKDIKPQNVMVTKKNKVKIMDFGIAETVRTSMSRIQNSTSSGTLVYMSPEQIKGKDVGKESDIYSFGAMLYELLSGQPPFYKGDINYQILHDKPETLTNVSDKLNNVILNCLEKEFKKRCKNFEEIISKLGGRVQKYEEEITSSRIKRVSETSSKIKSLAPFVIQTDPPGAKIWIAGKQLPQTTPIDTEHMTGEYQVEITKEGYETIKDTIHIDMNNPNKFYLELESLHGSLEIVPSEKGMEIWINGRKQEQKTPFTFENMVPGKYQVALKGDIFCLPEVEIELKKREHKIFIPKLKKYSYLQINTKYRTTFEIDGTIILANKKFQLIPGKKVIQSSLDFLQSFEIFLKDGEFTTYNLDENIKKNQLFIKCNGLEIEIDISCANSNNREVVKIMGDETFSLAPGVYDIIVRYKNLTKTYKADLRKNNKEINLYQDINPKIIHTKKMLERTIITIVSIGLFVLIALQTCGESIP